MLIGGVGIKLHRQLGSFLTDQKIAPTDLDDDRQVGRSLAGWKSGCQNIHLQVVSRLRPGDRIGGHQLLFERMESLPGSGRIVALSIAQAGATGHVGLDLQTVEIAIPLDARRPEGQQIGDRRSFQDLR